MIKKLLLILLCLPIIGFGQVLTKKIKRIAKKNVEIFVNPKFNNTLDFIITVDKATLQEEAQSQGIADKVSTALFQLGKNVVLEGEGNTIKITIRWDALNELKKLSGMIIDPEGKIVGSIQYNGPYIPNSHNNIAKAIAYKLSISE